MLRVGTDCSGIEAPIQALTQLKIKFKHVFSSEIDKYCIETIKANYSPEIIFGDKDGPYPEGDITKRNIKDVPDIDLYICGFPCQPFSTAGERRGLDDKRGNVFFSCIKLIKHKKPSYFILENVKGILHNNNGKTWEIIEKELNNLRKIGYTIDWKVLNTRDYGIPQNRERLFIVGTIYDFEWPSEIKMDKLENYVDWNDDIYQHTKINCSHIVKANKNIFISVGFQCNTYPNAHLYSPCVTANSKLWCVPLHRYANCKEYMLLQGFSLRTKQVVSSTQFIKQLGNSMSVNVLKKIFNNLIY